MIRNRVVSAALLTASLATAACDESMGPQREGRATVSVYLQDAPGDVDSVWVQVESLQLKGDSGMIELLEEPTALVNLVALRDSSIVLVEGAEVDVGAYDQLRIVLGGAVLQAGEDVYTMGGAEHPGGLPATGTLQCPSCAQSGLKVLLSRNIEVADSAETGVLLDFDVSQSFGHKAGKSGKWVMHPVIHAVQADPDDIEDGEVGGDIEGTIVLGVATDSTPVTVPACDGGPRTLKDFVPLATAMSILPGQTDTIAFAGEVELGVTGPATFEIHVTTFGAYALGYRAETPLTTQKLVWTATVTPGTAAVSEGDGEVGDVAFTITGVTCASLTP